MGSLNITTDRESIDPEIVHRWLSVSYWAAGRSLETVRRSMENSLNFGAFRDGRLVGYARVVTDRATFAWLCDVVVDEGERGSGLGKALVQAVVEHEDLRGIKRILLATKDAHGLYRRFGFEPLDHCDRWMAKLGEAQAQR